MLSFFILLAGAINAYPLNLVYFLEADTSGISNARPLTAWTVYSNCGISGNDQTSDCTAPTPAYPFDPPSNFGTTNGVPADFVGYVSRTRRASVARRAWWRSSQARDG